MHSLALSLTLSFLTMPQATAPMSPTATPNPNAARVIRYAEESEADPLSSTSADKRAAAAQFFEEDHETHAILCKNVYEQMHSNSAKNAHETYLQYIVSTAAFVYGHPEASKDSNAQNTAGLEAAAEVYKKFLAADPKSHNKFLDTVAKQKDSGTLKEFVTKICK